MALRITIDLFSGRPNPTVVVTGLEERELLERLGAAGAVGRGRARATTAAQPPSVPFLGYRGLVIEQAGDQATPAGRAPRAGRARATTASRLRVARGVVYADGEPRPAHDPLLESFVCSTAGPFRAAGLPAALFGTLEAEVARAQSVPARGTARAAGTAAGVADSCACAPLWEPAWWNDGVNIQIENNCYNYATNYRSDTYAQPGRANGAMYASMSAADVKSAALGDGLIEAPGRNRCPQRGHLVALFVYEWDFHWYRKQRSGNWTHKPGPDPIAQVDNAGSPISDPRTADRGLYATFGGFLIVQHGHVKIG